MLDFVYFLRKEVALMDIPESRQSPLSEDIVDDVLTMINEDIFYLEETRGGVIVLRRRNKEDPFILLIVVDRINKVLYDVYIKSTKSPRRDYYTLNYIRW